MSAGMGHMALMGLVMSVPCPALAVTLTRFVPRWDRVVPPAAVTLPVVAIVHFGTVVVWKYGHHTSWWSAAAHGLLLPAALALWAPVFGNRRRIPDTGRTFYLYTALPLLDLAGVWLVAVGEVAAGLAMIVGMIPMGLTAVVVTWEWIHREERRAVAVERAAYLGQRP